MTPDFNASARPAYGFMVIDQTSVVETDAQPRPQDGRLVRQYWFDMKTVPRMQEIVEHDNGDITFVGAQKLKDVDRSLLEKAHAALTILGGRPDPIDDCMDEKKCAELRQQMRVAESYASAPRRGWFF